MITLTKFRLSALLLTTAIAVSFAPAASAKSETQTETVIVKEKSVVSDTIVGDKMPNAKDGLAPASKPFADPRETRPAGSAIIGTSMQGGQFGPDVINYASTVARRTSNELVLNTTISQVENDEVLSRLANKVYLENNGPKYDNVTILWHVGQNPEPAAPFARTEVRKGNEVFEIIRVETK